MTSSADERAREARAIAAAWAAAGAAYAPYSRFRVGAAALLADGRVFSGCNVENASYGLTVCAERNALAAMVAAGAQEPVLVVVATETPEPTPPCGACRQVLAELAPNAEVLSVTRAHPAGNARTSVSALLPGAFTLRPAGRDGGGGSSASEPDADG